MSQTADRRPDRDLDYIDEYLDVARATMEQLDREVLDDIVEALLEVRRRNRTVYVMGNGGSASTATHFACDLAKYPIVGDRRRFRVLALTDNAPLISAWTNDGGFNSIFEEQMAAWLTEGDALVGFSVHGGSGAGDAGPWSQNMVRAMRAAREAGAVVIGFSGYDGGAMAEMADHCLVVPALVDRLGTPVIESVHVLVHHLLVSALRERIEGE